MEIKREKYLNKLINRKHNGLIKVITGIRRCGKSYLLNILFYKYLINEGILADHIIRFAFDSADDLNLIGENLIELDIKGRKVDPKKFMDYISTKIKDDNMYYLLLDEVQNLGSFEAVLNGYLRNTRLNFRQLEQTHTMENIIYNELRYRGFNVDVGVVEVFEKKEDGSRTKRQYEIDFIANMGSKRYYIQSAYEIESEGKLAKETRSFDKTDDSFKKIIVVS